jgi:hypothetical protein
MAARTMTYTLNMAATPKAAHVGLQALAWDFNSGTTKLGTLSDVVLLGKVPSGALITTKNLRFGATSATGGATWQLQLLAYDALGTFTLIATIADSMTSSATAASFNDNRPYKLSLSDDRAIQYAVLALNASTGATETTSISLQGFIHYTTDGSTI